jgi:hypothetical protein
MTARRFPIHPEDRAKRHRLSLEECVYWLMVARQGDLASLVVARDVYYLKHRRAFFSSRARGKTWLPEYRRLAGLTAFLIGEALRELGAT